jgi:hypothetical protein
MVCICTRGAESSTPFCFCLPARGSLYRRRRGLRVREANDTPAGERGFEVFLGVGDEASATIVTAATSDVDAAFDFDERSAREVSEVRATFAQRGSDARGRVPARLMIARSEGTSAPARMADSDRECAGASRSALPVKGVPVVAPSVDHPM